QTLNPAASIVPVTVMHASASRCASMGSAIAGAIRAWGKDVLIVVSSDMNHYEPEATTREKDALAIEEILALEPGRLLEVASREDITM
ncbi:MAG: AmmeMemoRadiSam system protein B, partial [Deltaproteobacteria bacterium RBG_19FT_COMBO_58_16]